MKPNYVILDYPSAYLDELKRKKVVEMIVKGMWCIVGRYGTNKTTLKKILDKEAK